MDVVEPTDYLRTAPPDAAHSVCGARACRLLPTESLTQGAPPVKLQQQVQHVGPTAAVPPGIQELDGEGGTLDSPHGLHLEHRLPVQQLHLQRCRFPGPCTDLVDSAEASTAQSPPPHNATLTLCTLGDGGERRSWQNREAISISIIVHAEDMFKNELSNQMLHMPWSKQKTF